MSATMIESVQARQRGAFDFEMHYDNQCALQNSCPIPAVKAHLQAHVLDINADRIRANDWSPILNSLRINKTLEFIGVRSYFQQPVDDGKSKKKLQQWRRKTPAIRSKEITYRLCRALRECLSNSTTVVCLELQGLPLRERDLQILTKGITKNTSIKHLSFEFCTISDEGVEILSKGIKNSPCVASLNFSGCGMTFQGADVLAKIIKHQSMKRHNEAWRDSLRYRRPDLDGMMGIRRITINRNPLMGDQGALAFAEALKDDLWLKALDLQQCGVSDTGAKALLQVLKFNTTMVVLDLRLNPLIDRELQQSIMEQVLINSDGQDSEFKWIRAEMPYDSQRSSSPRRRRTRTGGGFRSKGSKGGPGSGRKRSRSAGGLGFSKTFDVPEVTKPGPGFVPWRTAMRALSYRGYPNPVSAWDKENGASPDSPVVIINKENIDDAEDSYMRVRGINTSSFDDGESFTDVKEMKVELAQLRRCLQEEKEARNQADKKMLELTVENQRLKQEVALLRRTNGAGLLEDDKVLDSIEASFKKFHSFLDLLRDAGLSQLITIAGLDHAPTSIPFPSRSQPAHSAALPVTATDILRRIDLSDAQFADHPLDSSEQPNRSLYGIPEASPPSRDHDILTGTIRPHLVPDNYTQSQVLDPTLHPVEDDEYNFKPSTADELYRKLRRQAEVALERSRTYYDSSQVVTSTPHKPKSPLVPETPEPAPPGDDDKGKLSPKPDNRQKSPLSPEIAEIPETDNMSEAYSDTFEPSEHQIIRSMDEIADVSPSPPPGGRKSDDDDEY